MSTANTQRIPREIPLIERKGNIIYLLPRKNKNPKSDFLVSLDQLEYPFLIQVYNQKEDRFYHPDDLDMRFFLEKITYAVNTSPNKPFSVYIEKFNFEKFQKSVAYGSGNIWQVIRAT